MKKKIHPLLFFIKVNCACGNIINIKSVLNKNFSIDVCYKCHSFYTGKQKIIDKKGRMNILRKRFDKINFKF